MKRFISFMVMAAMLSGMCITAGAALPATPQNFGVVEDFEDGVLDSNYDAYVPNGTKAVIKGWTAGITEKYDNNVYELRTPAAATVAKINIVTKYCKNELKNAMSLSPLLAYLIH